MKISKIVPDRGNPALPPRRNNRDWFGSELQANLLYGLKWAPDSAKLPGTQTFWKSKFPYSYMDWSNNPFLKRIPNALKLQVLAREPWRVISERQDRERRRKEWESRRQVFASHQEVYRQLYASMFQVGWTDANQMSRRLGESIVVSTPTEPKREARWHSKFLQGSR